LRLISLGSISISATWIASSSALFISFLIYRVLSGKKIGDWYWNAFFLYFLVWKLSYILFNLKLFLGMPLSVIYFNGGIKGHLLALAVLSLYLLYFTGKKYQSIAVEAPNLFLLYFINYEGIINLITKYYMEAFSNLLLLLGYLFLHITLKWKKNLISYQIFILLILLMLLLLSIFHTLFSIDGLTIIWFGVTVFILMKKVNKEERLLE
jgi:hypothetical protein